MAVCRTPEESVLESNIAYWKRGALLLLVASKLQSDLFVCLFSVGVMAFEVEEMLVASVSVSDCGELRNVHSTLSLYSRYKR